MFSFRSFLAASALALVATSCSRQHLDPSVDPDVTAVRVDNESPSDVTLLLVDRAAPGCGWRGVARQRIGRVLADTSKLLAVPVEMLAASASLQLIVRPVNAM